jgi:hypothetical protein
MRLPWQARDYQRVCADCGHTWRVPRQFARRRVQSISGMSVASRRRIDRSELQREIESSMAISEEAEAFASCPRCGSDRYTQRAAWS